VDDEEDDGLSLRRFESGSAKPPQIIDEGSSSSDEDEPKPPQMVDDGGSSSDEDEPQSPPPLSEEELKMIAGGAWDAELAGLYQHVANCPCQGNNAPAVNKMWELPQKAGHEGPRRAVIEVAA